MFWFCVGGTVLWTLFTKKCHVADVLLVFSLLLWLSGLDWKILSNSLHLMKRSTVRLVRVPIILARIST